MNLYNRFLFCNMFLPLGRYLHGGYYWNRKTSMPLLYNFHAPFLLMLFILYVIADYIYEIQGFAFMMP